jgi:hypothetical protein
MQMVPRAAPIKKEVALLGGMKKSGGITAIAVEQKGRIRRPRLARSNMGPSWAQTMRRVLKALDGIIGQSRLGRLPETPQRNPAEVRNADDVRLATGAVHACRRQCPLPADPSAARKLVAITTKERPK